MLLALYRAGSWVALMAPRGFCNWIARRAADFYSARAPADRQAVRANLATVLGKSPDQISEAQVSEVFRHFAMYLVDFFRFSRLTPQQLQRLVQFDGLDHMRQALAQRRGAIGLTAHLGNYELAGAAVATLGMPIRAVVLTHRNAGVDQYFTRQRQRVGVEGIPIQKIGRKAFLLEAVKAIGDNQVLGLVGDRDFFDHGIEVTMFGRKFKAPTGAAWFSIKTGAPIIPTFLVREEDSHYRLIMEAPIEPIQGVARDEAIRQMTQRWIDILAGYIRRYPTQWYLFKEFWSPVGADIL